jgi:peroxin-6
VILVSTDAKSYAVATQDSAAFESQLADQNEVVREGEGISLAGAGSTGRWKVAMAEPVLQGVVQKGYTRFLVLPPAAGVEEFGVDSAGEGHAELEAGASSGDEGTIRGAEDSEEGDQDDYEIDEAFLAASVLSPGRQSLPPTPLSPPSSNGLALTNGHAAFPLESTSSSTKPSPTSIAVLPASLQQSIPSPLLIPRPPNDEDDTPRVYLRTSDLGRLGLFSGDWVVVGDEGTGHRRLARAFAGAGLLPETSADG